MRQNALGVAVEAGSMRIDKWLWFARFAKSRSLAAKLCSAGAVVVGGRPAAKPHQPVRIGDIVAVPQGDLIHTVRIVALGARRGPATEARRLYEMQAPPRPIAPSEPHWEMLLGEEEDAEPIPG
jgi:ribosome-associated heat shock protein Hsp15